MKETPNYFAIIPAEVRYNDDLRPNEKLLFGEITALSNATGVCTASNNYFARLYNVVPSAITKWVKDLEKYDYIEVQYVKEGNEIKKRIIKLKGIHKYDDVFTKVIGGYSQKLKENNINSLNNTSNKEIYKESFESLWELYPNKKGKINALKSFEKAIKDGITVEEITLGLQNYIAYIKAENIEPRYIKNGSTWFNQRCWEDDYTIRRKPTTKDLAENIDFTDFLNEGRKQ